MDLVVNYMTANALTRGELTVFGGSQWRPLVHVMDIAEAIVHNLERPVRGIYNLATLNIQIKDLAALVARITGCRIRYTEQKFQDQRDYHVATAKALRDGIFNPYTVRTVEDGIRDITELISLCRIKDAESEVYFNVRHVERLMSYGQFT
jgi:nucleoside-diphosphate-sugar epimerase